MADWKAELVSARTHLSLAGNLLRQELPPEIQDAYNQLTGIQPGGKWQELAKVHPTPEVILLGDLTDLANRLAGILTVYQGLAHPTDLSLVTHRER